MRRGERICYLIAAVLAMVSCSTSENDLIVKITNPVNVEENAMIHSIAINLVSEVEYNILMTHAGRQTKQDSIPTVKVSFADENQMAQEIEIDYGLSNHPDYLGRNKRGKIHSEIQGDYCTAECSVSIEFQDFYLNDMQVSGSVQIYTTGYNEQDHISFEINYEDVIFTDKNGQEYTFNGSFSKDWTGGFESLENPWDDQFLISGSASGINSEHRNYSSQISSDLLISRSCEFIPQGEIEFTVDTESCSINFGDGLCDNKGIFIRNGEKTPFEYGRYVFRYQE